MIRGNNYRKYEVFQCTKGTAGIIGTDLIKREEGFLAKCFLVPADTKISIKL